MRVFCVLARQSSSRLPTKLRAVTGEVPKTLKGKKFEKISNETFTSAFRWMVRGPNNYPTKEATTTRHKANRGVLKTFQRNNRATCVRHFDRRSTLTMDKLSPFRT